MSLLVTASIFSSRLLKAFSRNVLSTLSCVALTSLSLEFSPRTYFSFPQKIHSSSYTLESKDTFRFCLVIPPVSLHRTSTLLSAFLFSDSKSLFIVTYFCIFGDKKLKGLHVPLHFLLFQELVCGSSLRQLLTGLAKSRNLVDLLDVHRVQY